MNSMAKALLINLETDGQSKGRTALHLAFTVWSKTHELSWRNSDLSYAAIVICKMILGSHERTLFGLLGCWKYRRHIYSNVVCPTRPSDPIRGRPTIGCFYCIFNPKAKLLLNLVVHIFLLVWKQEWYPYATNLSDDEPGVPSLAVYTRPIQPGCELENLKGVKNAA